MALWHYINFVLLLLLLLYDIHYTLLLFKKKNRNSWLLNITEKNLSRNSERQSHAVYRERQNYSPVSHLPTAGRVGYCRAGDDAWSGSTRHWTDSDCADTARSACGRSVRLEPASSPPDSASSRYLLPQQPDVNNVILYGLTDTAADWVLTPARASPIKLSHYSCCYFM